METLANTVVAGIILHPCCESPNIMDNTGDCYDEACLWCLNCHTKSYGMFRWSRARAWNKLIVARAQESAPKAWEKGVPWP